jgi:hypothetical protein
LPNSLNLCKVGADQNGVSDCHVNGVGDKDFSSSPRPSPPVFFVGCGLPRYDASEYHLIRGIASDVTPHLDREIVEVQKHGGNIRGDL